MKIIFAEQAWEDYLYWQKADRALLRKLNGLIREITRTPYEGTGKPEPLRGDLSGWWSRRINREHRLVYRVEEVEEEAVLIAQCRRHY